MNKWQEFAELHGMTNQEFCQEVIECAQAVLAIDLVSESNEKLERISSQHDGVYRLTFERIVK